MSERRGPAPAQLEELRRLAARYGLRLELVDRLTLRPQEGARSLGVGLRKVEGWVASGRLGARKPDWEKIGGPPLPIVTVAGSAPPRNVGANAAGAARCEGVFP